MIAEDQAKAKAGGFSPKRLYVISQNDTTERCKARREEYLNHGVKPTDKFIKYCGFQGDYTGCITYMKNIFEVESMKEELFDGISMGKVIYHIMRIVYLNPSFIDIVENQMKIKQKGYGKH